MIITQLSTLLIVYFSCATVLALLGHLIGAGRIRLLRQVPCKVIDVYAVTHKNSLYGRLLLKAPNGETFELPTIAVQEWDGFKLKYENWELRVGDRVTIPLMGRTYLKSYITSVKGV